MRFSSPARIDLAGGTLDIAPLCFMVDGATTLNLAIDLRSQVRVKAGAGAESTVRFGGQPIRKAQDECLFREALAYFDVGQPFDFHVNSDVPRGSGLGGSSTLLVSLCAALHRVTRQSQASNDQLVRMVTVLEHRILGKPAGTQDAIAAILGGLNLITFEQGMPGSQHLAIPTFLEGPIDLVYTPVQHNSGINNWRIVKAACEGDDQILDLLRKLADNARSMARAIVEENRSGFIDGLRLEAEMRHRLAAGILPQPMEAFLTEIGHGAVGKMCGAGGGGCMLLFGADRIGDQLRPIARRHGLDILTVRAESRGSMEVHP